MTAATSRRPTDAQTGWIACAAAGVLFGFAVPFAKRTGRDVDAVLEAGLLYIGAGVALLPFALRSWRGIRWRRATVLRLAGAVIAGGGVGPVLLMTALARLPSATTTTLLTLEIVFTAVLARAAFAEHIGRRTGIGLVVVTLGAVVAGGGGVPAARWPVLLVAGACLCWAFDNNITAALDDVPPAVITVAKGLVAGPVNVTIALLHGAGRPGVGTTGAILVVGALGYGCSIVAWISGARRIGAARGQLVFALAPLWGALAAWLVVGEHIRPAVVGGLAVALVGTFVASTDHHGHEHAHRPMRHDHRHGHDAHHDPHDIAHGGPPGEPDRPGTVHRHEHGHQPTVHTHPHVPDRHHRHG